MWLLLLANISHSPTIFFFNLWELPWQGVVANVFRLTRHTELHPFLLMISQNYSSLLNY